MHQINAKAPTPAPMPINMPINPHLRRKVAPSPMSGISFNQSRFNTRTANQPAQTRLLLLWRVCTPPPKSSAIGFMAVIHAPGSGMSCVAGEEMRKLEGVSRAAPSQETKLWREFPAGDHPRPGPGQIAGRPEVASLSAFPVVQEDKLAGILTRREAETALRENRSLNWKVSRPACRTRRSATARAAGRVPQQLRRPSG